MSYIIAVAGKGGTGKTTIASLLVTQLAKQDGRTILGIDADPNSNMAEALGLKVKDNIGRIVDSVAKNPAVVPSGMSKDVYIDFQIQSSILEEKGFDLLTMGRPEGPGCYCYVNNLLRGMLKKLADSYDYVVIDNEAGFEHLSRRTMRRADALLVVSDLSEAGLRAAQRITALTKELELEIKKGFLVINRAGGDFGTDKIAALGLELAGCIQEDTNLLKLSQQGKPLVYLEESSPALAGLKVILDKIILKKPET